MSEVIYRILLSGRDPGWTKEDNGKRVLGDTQSGVEWPQMVLSRINFLNVEWCFLSFCSFSSDEKWIFFFSLSLGHDWNWNLGILSTLWALQIRLGKGKAAKGAHYYLATWNSF